MQSSKMVKIGSVGAGEAASCGSVSKNRLSYIICQGTGMIEIPSPARGVRSVTKMSSVQKQIVNICTPNKTPLRLTWSLTMIGKKKST
eukprot:2774156-Amphidinium_carterae.1